MMLPFGSNREINKPYIETMSISQATLCQRAVTKLIVLMALLIALLLAEVSIAQELEKDPCDKEAIMHLQGTVCLPVGWVLVEGPEKPEGRSCGGPNEELGPPIEHHVCLCDEGSDGEFKCSDPIEINVRTNLDVVKRVSPVDGTVREVHGILYMKVSRLFYNRVAGAAEFILRNRETGQTWTEIVEVGLAFGRLIDVTAIFNFRDNPLPPGRYEMKATIPRELIVEARATQLISGSPQVTRFILTPLNEAIKRFRVNR